MRGVQGKTQPKAAHISGGALRQCDDCENVWLKIARANGRSRLASGRDRVTSQFPHWWTTLRRDRGRSTTWGRSWLLNRCGPLSSARGRKKQDRAPVDAVTPTREDANGRDLHAAVFPLRAVQEVLMKGILEAEVAG